MRFQDVRGVLIAWMFSRRERDPGVLQIVSTGVQDLGILVLPLTKQSQRIPEITEYLEHLATNLFPQPLRSHPDWCLKTLEFETRGPTPPDSGPTPTERRVQGRVWAGAFFRITNRG